MYFTVPNPNPSFSVLADIQPAFRAFLDRQTQAIRYAKDGTVYALCFLLLTVFAMTYTMFMEKRLWLRFASRRCASSFSPSSLSAVIICWQDGETLTMLYRKSGLFFLWMRIAMPGLPSIQKSVHSSSSQPASHPTYGIVRVSSCSSVRVNMDATLPFRIQDFPNGSRLLIRICGNRISRRCSGVNIPVPSPIGSFYAHISMPDLFKLSIPACFIKTWFDETLESAQVLIMQIFVVQPHTAILCVYQDGAVWKILSFGLVYWLL